MRKQLLTWATTGLSKDCCKRPNPEEVLSTFSISVEIPFIGIWVPGTEIVLEVEETNQNNISNEC